MLSSLYDGVFIAKRMGQREGHPSTTGLCTLALRESQGCAKFSNLLTNFLETTLKLLT